MTNKSVFFKKNILGDIRIFLYSLYTYVYIYIYINGIFIKLILNLIYNE